MKEESAKTALVIFGLQNATALGNSTPFKGRASCECDVGKRERSCSLDWLPLGQHLQGGPSAWCLGWVDCDLGCSTTFCSTAQSVLPISHQPKQNLAEGGNSQVKVNQIQQSEQMDHPAIVRLLWPLPAKAYLLMRAWPTCAGTRSSRTLPCNTTVVPTHLPNRTDSEQWQTITEMEKMKQLHNNDDDSIAITSKDIIQKYYHNHFPARPHWFFALVGRTSFQQCCVSLEWTYMNEDTKCAREWHWPDRIQDSESNRLFTRGCRDGLPNHSASSNNNSLSKRTRDPSNSAPLPVSNLVRKASSDRSWSASISPDITESSPRALPPSIRLINVMTPLQGVYE